MHVHHAEDEGFFVLEGEVDFYLAGAAAHRARPGDFVFGPRGVPHRFEVVTPEARMLVLGTPGGAERFFREMGEPARAATLPVPQAPDVERVVAIAAAHDVEILPHPRSSRRHQRSRGNGGRHRPCCLEFQRS